jgi:hypothetical protein
MTGRIEVSTQEVFTGKWFGVISYYPNNPQQRERAAEMVLALRRLGLNAKDNEVAE